MAILRIFEGLFGFVRLIMLARLLEPRDFGLFGIVVMVMGFIQTFTRPGLWGALVQKKEDIDSDLDDVWTINLFRGALLFISLLMIAPFTSAYFNEPEITSLMRFVGISLLVQGAVNPGIVYFWKELENRKQFIFQISGTISDLVISILCAIILQNTWAFIIGMFARDLMQLIVSHVLVSHRVRFSFSFSRVRKLYHFGLWLMLSGILDFFLQQGSQAVIAKALNPVALGFYVMAAQISFMLCRNIIVIISRVTFPAYSKLQDDINRLSQAFIKTFKIVALFIVPVTVGIFIVADDFIKIFLGEKWLEIIPLLRILLIGTALHAFDRTVYPVFQSIGKPQIETKIRLVQIIIFFGGIFLLVDRMGLLGVGYSFLAGEIFIGFLLWKELVSSTVCSLKSIVQVLTFPMISAILLAGTVFICKSILTESIMNFFFYVAAGVLIYIGAVYLLDRYLNFGIVGIIRGVILKV